MAGELRELIHEFDFEDKAECRRVRSANSYIQWIFGRALIQILGYARSPTDVIISQQRGPDPLCSSLNVVHIPAGHDAATPRMQQPCAAWFIDPLTARVEAGWRLQGANHTAGT